MGHPSSEARAHFALRDTGGNATHRLRMCWIELPKAATSARSAKGGLTRSVWRSSPRSGAEPTIPATPPRNQCKHRSLLVPVGSSLVSLPSLHRSQIDGLSIVSPAILATYRAAWNASPLCLAELKTSSVRKTVTRLRWTPDKAMPFSFPMSFDARELVFEDLRKGRRRELKVSRRGQCATATNPAL